VSRRRRREPIGDVEDDHAPAIARRVNEPEVQPVDVLCGESAQALAASRIVTPFAFKEATSDPA
jgi:hypothetical protein